MVGLQTLDLAIGVRVPASQPQRIHLGVAQKVRIVSWTQEFLCKAIHLPTGKVRWSVL